MRRALPLLLLLASFSLPSRADNRRGGTFDISAGPSVVYVQGRYGAALCGAGAQCGGFALEALGLGAGFFLTPRLSVTLRASHMFISDGKHVAFHGASVQFYPLSRMFVGVGPGLVTWGGPTSFLAQAPEAGDRSGFGMHLRLGVTLVESARHALAIYAQLYPGFFKDGTVVAMGLGLEWQLR